MKMQSWGHEKCEIDFRLLKFSFYDRQMPPWKHSTFSCFAQNFWNFFPCSNDHNVSQSTQTSSEIAPNDSSRSSLSRHSRLKNCGNPKRWKRLWKQNLSDFLKFDLRPIFVSNCSKSIEGSAISYVNLLATLTQTFCNIKKLRLRGGHGGCLAPRRGVKKIFFHRSSQKFGGRSSFSRWTTEFQGFLPELYSFRETRPQSVEKIGSVALKKVKKIFITEFNQNLVLRSNFDADYEYDVYFCLNFRTKEKIGPEVMTLSTPYHQIFVKIGEKNFFGPSFGEPNIPHGPP